MYWCIMMRKMNVKSEKKCNEIKKRENNYCFKSDRALTNQIRCIMMRSNNVKGN